jgi:DNA replication protein DnaC
MSKIPPRYESAIFEDVPEAIKEAYSNLSDKGIYIHGSVGTGKTHIAYALLKKTRADGRSAMFWNTTEMMRDIRRDLDRDSYDKTHTDSFLMDFKGVLFLDDIGSEKMTDWVAETFYLIINRRYNYILPTVFTSNFSIAELADRIGDRTVSRIVEMCKVIPLNGDDRRLSKIINKNK